MFKIVLIILYSIISYHIVIAAEVKESQDVLFDPTESTQTNFQLTAIAINAKEKFCIINNTVMKIGSEICDYFVTNIENEKVILQNSEGKITLLTIQ